MVRLRRTALLIDCLLELQTDPILLQDGTFEQIILDIKAEPYRTNDAMRRSVRRYNIPPQPLSSLKIKYKM